MSRSRSQTRDAIEREGERIRRDLLARQPATIEAGTLSLADPEERRAGSKPLFVLTDREGRKYAFKVAHPALMAAEQAAYELRLLGRRAAVPSRVVVVDLGASGPTSGLLKPYLDFEQKLELATDTAAWSELQRGVMLLEHAWEWFLDNLDTNPSQYALLGPEKYPLNIDWDRAFAYEGNSELTRFAKYRTVLPNARNFLYSDYVEGRVYLDFSLLEHEARRVRHLPREEVERVARAYAAIRFSGAQEVEEFVRRVLLRQENIQSEVEYFVLSLKKERRQLSVSGRRGAGAVLGKLAKHAWTNWQRLLNAGSRGPIGTFSRHIISAGRGFSLLGRGATDDTGGRR